LPGLRFHRAHDGTTRIRALRVPVMNRRPQTMRPRIARRLWELIGVAILSSCGARSVLSAVEESEGGEAPSPAEGDASCPSSCATDSSAVPSPQVDAGAEHTSAALDASADHANVARDAGAGNADDAAPTMACTSMGGPTLVGGGECHTSWQATCGTTDYQISCSCPIGMCACFGPNPHTISFPSCPRCLMITALHRQLFALCGFPDPG